MTITKYSAIFSMVVLMAGVTLAATSLFVNVEALKDSDFKKKINSKKCTTFNLNINGETIREIRRGDPICLKINTNKIINSID